jgi:hypothetical protein
MFDRPENEVIIRKPFYVIETAIVNVMGTYWTFLVISVHFLLNTMAVIQSCTFRFH